mgnify:CR=1 FL=1
MIAVRPVLPLVNYAVNYEYIVKNLCENRTQPQSTCKGKCYVEKELAKTEKQSNSTQVIKIGGLDVFISCDIITSPEENSEYIQKTLVSKYFNFHTSEYTSRIFHPPLV